MCSSDLPIYQRNDFITREGKVYDKSESYIASGAIGKDERPLDVGMDIFHRGMCLPSDNKMTIEQQDRIIEIIKSCFL